VITAGSWQVPDVASRDARRGQMALSEAPGMGEDSPKMRGHGHCWLRGNAAVWNLEKVGC